MSGPFTSTSRRSLVVGALVVGVAAIVLLVPVLELWDADPSVPIASVYEPENGYQYAPDAPFYLMLAKGGIDHAWFLTNPTLGWPLGQQLYDLPQSLDNLNLLEIKALGLVFGDPGTTVNAFFVLTFAMVAVSAFLVLRRLRVSALTSFVVALLYTFLPYHFSRGAPHLLLSAYWVVPIAIYLVLRVVSPQPPFTADSMNARRGFRVQLFDRSGILWLFACAAIASTGSYYGVFAVLLLVIVSLIDVIANRRARVAVSAGIAIGTIALVAFVNLLPTIVYWTVEGTNAAMPRRVPYETEMQGLKVSQLFLPIEHHRVGVFAEAEADGLRSTPVLSEEGQNLGAIAAVGLVLLLGTLLVAARGPPTFRGDTPDAVSSDGSAAADGLTPVAVLRTLGVLTIVAILLGTVSGFSFLISNAGFREIRSWNRIVVFVAFAAFVAVAIGLDWIARRVPERPWRTPVVVLGLSLVLALGVLDQVSPSSIPDYAATKARWESDKAFVADIERTLGDRGAPRSDRASERPAVFQLPYRYFPEAPATDSTGGLGPYDLVRGYLHSDDLNWSWGAVRGRGADWQVRAVRHSAEDFLDRIAAVGFTGIMLDRTSDYDDGAPSAGAISAVLGAPKASGDGELVFWDLRDHAEELLRDLGRRGVERLRVETLANRPA